MENQVSIIINGDRYDSVQEEAAKCTHCDLQSVCNEDTYENLCYALTPLSVFKKSNKGFER